MKKTSVYLTEAQLDRLRRIAEAEGRSQAEVLRDAILLYPSREGGRRVFAMDGAGQGPGGTIADIPEEDLLRGFGE